jgi:hypothetical protein
MTEVLTLAFCVRCQRKTLRRVYEDGSQGTCMGHDPRFQTKAQQKRRAEQEREHQNPSLFDVGAR